MEVKNTTTKKQRNRNQTKIEIRSRKVISKNWNNKKARESKGNGEESAINLDNGHSFLIIALLCDSISFYDYLDERAAVSHLRSVQRWCRLDNAMS